MTAYTRSIDLAGLSMKHYSTYRSLSKDFVLDYAFFISDKILLILSKFVIIFMVIEFSDLSVYLVGKLI